MRVTGTSTYTAMSTALGSSLSRVVELQSQIGTGRRINRASDDPVGAAVAQRYRSYESDQGAYTRAADDAVTRLSASDTALQSASTALRRLRELAVQAGNDSLTPQARTAIASEMASLRDELHDLSNTQHNGQALFGGFAGRAVDRAPDGTWSYTGDDGTVSRRVGAGVVVPANVDGRTAFGFDQPPGEDLLSVVDRLTAAASSGDRSELATGQDLLAARTTGVLRALGQVGASTNRVEAARARGQQFVEQITAERSDIEDIDLASAVLQLNQAQVGYQAALGAVAKANLPSLADFLR